MIPINFYAYPSFLPNVSSIDFQVSPLNWDSDKLPLGSISMFRLFPHGLPLIALVPKHIKLDVYTWFITSV